MHELIAGIGVWWHRLVGRHPLVRRADRAEAWVWVAALAVIGLATPVAIAVGSAVHDIRSDIYAQEAEDRFEVTATAVDDGFVEVGPGPAEVSFVVRATWTYAGTDHEDLVDWPDPAETGDRQSIWVDRQGQQARPPSSPSRADGDAVGVGVSAWIGVTAVVISIAYTIVGLVDRRRTSEWTREFASMDHQPQKSS